MIAVYEVRRPRRLRVLCWAAGCLGTPVVPEAQERALFDLYRNVTEERTVLKYEARLTALGDAEQATETNQKEP